MARFYPDLAFNRTRNVSEAACRVTKLAPLVIPSVHQRFFTASTFSEESKGCKITVVRMLKIIHHALCASFRFPVTAAT
jgi:hypothetical protein